MKRKTLKGYGLLGHGTEKGMETGDLLCSRNARPEKDGKGSLVVLLLAERAR
ncbi:MAG: hypothetical protein AABY96_06680 [Nitrospirota bacterium]